VVRLRPGEPPIALSDDDLVDVAVFVRSAGARAPLTRADLDAARDFIAAFRARGDARLTGR